ncbi:nuclear transport factor 2 family protein [Belliella pelovolcani]|uniref:SnoaL-like domain-containing protein n=1 Tax=Belliella pelovolcani TaxID=529505 RepID=A0A1N7PP73_9BACT|nr:nuclear transport factor 2 family protein [Belliella pelovolcani]SIT12179.1 hypothetical protein SAMN05421761_11850 [Belliella pelovolcani]
MQDEKRLIVEDYITAYNKFDVEGMVKNLHEEVEFQNISGGKIDFETKGIESFRNQAIAALDYFSSRKQVITNMTLTDTLVQIEIDYEAILKQDFPNGMKKGDCLKLKGKSTFSFEDKLIIKIQDES